MLYCGNCRKKTYWKRNYGIGTLILVLITGFWFILALPFYPKRCSCCGNDKTNLSLFPTTCIEINLDCNPKTKVLYCPFCLTILEGSKCPECNYRKEN